MDTGAGEAASLFGAADSAPDLFSTAAGVDDPYAAFQVQDAEATNGQQSGPVASDLFGGAADGTDFFNAADTVSSDSDVQPSWDAAVHQQYTQATAGAAQAATAGSYYSQQYQQDGWYGHQSQTSTYEPTQTQTSAAYGMYNQYSTQTAAQRDPYAPYASNTAPVLPPATQGTAPTAASYDPYKPTSQPVSNGYATTTTSSAYSSYDPYKPTQPAPSRPAASHVSYPSAAGPKVARTTPSLAAAIAPPAPPVNVPVSPYRPKTSNAYDPPLPPPKQSRRTSAQYLFSPPAGQQDLGAPPQSPTPLPPPPRKPPPKRVEQHSRIASPPVAHNHPVHEHPGPVTSQNMGYEGLPYAGGSGPYTEVPSSAYESNGHAQPSLPSSDTSFPTQWNGINRLDVKSPGTSVSPPLSVTGINQIARPPNSPSEAWIEAESAATTSQFAQPGQMQMGYAPDVYPQPPSTFSAPYADEEGLEVSHYEPSEAVNVPDRTKSPWEAVNGLGSTMANGGAYAPNIYSPERTKSPGNASIRSWSSAGGPPSNRVQSYAVPTSPPPPHVLQQPLQQPHVAPPSSYEPRSDPRRAASPASISSVTGSLNGIHDSYALSNQNRNRSVSNTSAMSSISAVLEDPYAPSHHIRQQPSDGSSKGSISGAYDKVPSVTAALPPRQMTAHDASGAQVLTVPPMAQSTYAPSPSLLGLNDPLGRASARVPVVSFGFGGKFVTCFHGASSLNTGFDVALASRQSTDIKVYVLNKVIPESALDSSAASYPGPLFSDPGTPSTSLVRTGASTQTKTKKARVIKYLEERAEELSRGIGYFHTDSPDGKRAEAKQVLIKLLKVMVENDGRLSGSPQVDTAVRAALVPRTSSGAPDTLRIASSLGGSDLQLQSPHVPTSPSPYMSLASSSQELNDTPVTVHTVRSSNLDKIQEFLLRGDRRAACHYASDEKLWAHAMVIASSIDKDIWKEVVSEFVRTELADKSNKGTLPGKDKGLSSGTTREALRVAYSVFSGQGPASVQELLPPKPLVHGSQSLQLPSSSISSMTPMSAGFSAPVEPMNLPVEVLAKWTEAVAMIYTNPMTLETSSTLTALGDQLVANQWYEAAHACYLLSPQTSPIGTSGRIILLGSPGPSSWRSVANDPDPIILTEIAEFALSLATPAKGQEAFTGLPHLQPYRLIRAAVLAEIGHVQLANRYCEAISTCLNRSTSYVSPTFAAQLRGLSDRLVAAPQIDKSGSWIGSKVSKPSLDTIGNWLEGRLTKFIAGEDSPLPPDASQKGRQQAFSGPFAHYSTISSASTSAAPSPQQSRIDLTDIPTSPPPPFRTGSAMALRSSAAPQVQINRSSSAMDYVRPAFNRKSSPIPRVSSASAATSTFAEASLYSQALNGHAFGNNSKQSLSDLRMNDVAEEPYQERMSGSTGGTWWGSPESNAPTPTASSFAHMNEDATTESPSGFISLMDDTSFSSTPTAAQAPTSYSNRLDEYDEEDDLGLGNSTHRVERQASAGAQKADTTPAQEISRNEVKPAELAQKQESKSAASAASASSGSWLSRIWKRESTPGPVKANLGDSTTFYYDKELKRWVNKNASSEAANPAQPPPPPRAQTASPGRSFGTLPNGTTPPPPPPIRPATANANAFDNPTGPPKAPMRVRSNLVPAQTDDSSSAPPTPLNSTMAPPPGSGPPPPGGRSTARAKRPVRNRYVDVFQQPAEGN
ncbi:uncharacterized protein FIBRA_04461 [Fibroporia radiculosa]|uniref:Protein transport protein sec16 n=1 Tax=Fibroporia radiculosa TaxID=599839 RepID=J4IA64_9APHY|nr:uncharacterized protein FIBRA_04461 [Fibroporia radiculosa]CCM02366.1 predicted protein [Fibroporia radiculosa]